MAERSVHVPFWIVVKVESGIPACVEAYADARSACLREQRLRQRMNAENDETGVFRIARVRGDKSPSQELAVEWLD
jgi:hypothetical protein